MSEPPTPDPDDRRPHLTAHLVWQVAMIHGQLPADDPLRDPAWPTRSKVVVYPDADGVDRAAVAIPDLCLLYTLAETTDGLPVVVITYDDDQDVRHVIGAWRDGLPHATANVRDHVDARFDTLVGHLPSALADEVRQAVADEDVAWTDHLAAATAIGRLAFLTPARHRGYVLDRDRAGRPYAQVTTIDPDTGGIASSASFRDGDCIAGQVGRIVLEG